MIDRLLGENRQRHIAGLPPFQGGLAGYISYDYGRWLEPHARIPEFAPLCPDLMLHHYDCVAAFDHLQERAWIIRTTPERADELEELLRAPPQVTGSHAIEGWQSNFTREDYEKGDGPHGRIHSGGRHLPGQHHPDVSGRRSRRASIPLGFYRVLRQKNPATFAAYLDYGTIQIASSSPERLLRYDGTTVEARPIKGTRRRDADPARDANLIADLTSSRKDRAENVMIVDLLRNDLSRVSKPGTVKVPVLCGLETYAKVHHLVSVITSRAEGRTTARRSDRRHLPRRLDHRRAEDPRHGDHRRDRAGARAASIAAPSAISASTAARDLNIAIRTAQFRGRHGARAGRRRHHGALAVPPPSTRKASPRSSASWRRSAP